MKKGFVSFIKSLLLFACFAIVIYVILLCTWGDLAPAILKKNLIYQNGSYGFTNSRIREARNTKNIDVLFLGSSHAYRSFDPRIFERYGMSSFNLGTSAQTPMQTEILLRRYLDSLNPKTIIYDVYPGTFASDGVESSLDILANDNIDLNAVRMALRLKNIKVMNTLIYAVYTNCLRRNNAANEGRENGTDKYIKGGFVERELSFYHQQTDLVKSKWEFNSLQCHAFENIVRLIRNKGIRLLLVQAPVTKSLYQSYTNNDAFDRTMSRYAYYNFNNLLEIKDSLQFYDKDHLNAQGVALFDEALVTSFFKSH